MSVSGDWASDIWLWVLTSLENSPVIVEMAAESGVRVSIPWDWSSDVWLRILIGLNVSPIVMEMAREG